MTEQPCATEGCPRPAAYKTRTRPTWCLECIDRAFSDGGLTPVAPFTKPTGWRLSRCQACGVVAHYRFEYVLDRNAAGEPVCRACFWWAWMEPQRTPQDRALRGAIANLLRTNTVEEIRTQYAEAAVRDYFQDRWWSPERWVAELDQHGYDLVQTVVEYSDAADPVVAECRSCGRISAARMGDFAWECSCVRGVSTGQAARKRETRELFSESKSPALTWWDTDRNDDATFQSITPRARRTCHWVCPDCQYQFEKPVRQMSDDPACPRCQEQLGRERREQQEQWDVTPISAVPVLMAAWTDSEDPATVTVGLCGTRHLECPSGHHPYTRPITYLENGCPHCRGLISAQTKTWLADFEPELTSQWHPDRNGKLTPGNVVVDSKRVVWWRADCCGHEWQEAVRDRNISPRLRCPSCRTLLNSLAWRDPGLAAEWSPNNRVGPWNVFPTSATPLTPEWICAVNPAHMWQAPLSSRSNGSECPECRETGKSRVELDHHAAAEDVFGQARSGQVLRNDSFQTRASWTADITVDLNQALLVIEYDGAYWHRPSAKQLVDERKTQDLLAAGYLVVRLREDDLLALPIADPHYREIRVYSAAPRPQATMSQVHQWAQGLPATDE